MEVNHKNARRADYSVDIGEEDLGVLGLPVVQPARLDNDPIVETVTPEERARKEELAKMAANMIITGEPRGSYFVRNPGF